MAHLWIVRHGDAPRYHAGQTHLDLAPLSEKGVAQANNAALNLQDEFYDRPDAMYSASSFRSREMARRIAGYAGWSMAIEQVPAFNHTLKDNIGLVTLRPVEEVQADLRRWSKHELGVHSTVVTIMSKRVIEIMLSGYLDLDPSLIDRDGGALSIPNGSIVRLVTARGGWVEEVINPPTLLEVQDEL